MSDNFVMYQALPLQSKEGYNKLMKKNEKGFVSIITAATIMIILALITIGFTIIVQREQRQSLDRQLSRQALYAAESGINQTFNALVSDNTIPDEKLDDCDPSVGGINPVVDAEDQIEYTCILYDKSPTRLDFIISPTDSKVVELRTFTDEPFTQINIEWGSTDPDLNDPTSLPPCNNSAREFPRDRTDSIPVLRVDLTNLADLSRNALLNNSAYMYLSPCNGSRGSDGVNSYAFREAVDNDNVIPVRCSGSGSTPCRLTVPIDLNVDNTASFLGRIRPIYSDVNVVIRGELAPSIPGPAEVEFAGQYSIDVTARANDVVRRLRAALPITSTELKPEAVLQSFQGVCKQLDVDTSIGTVTDNC